MRDGNTVLLCGYAKLPANITVENVYHVMLVAVRFDKRSGIILDAEASMVTKLAKEFINEIIIGYNLNDGPDKLIETINDCYYGSAKKAVETALRMVFVKYQDYMADHMFQK